MPKVDVAILLDPGNDWIGRYVRQLAEDKELNSRYEFHFSSNPYDVKGYEIVFILGYTKLLSKDILDANKLNLVIHESDLPRGKGFAPVQWQVLEGKRSIPVCLIEAIEEVDAGDILERGFIELTGYELYDGIREKQAMTTLDLIKRFLLEYPDIRREKQKGEETFYRKRTEQDDELEVDKTLREQFNHLRIANNKDWPAYFVIDGHKYYIRVSWE